MFTYEAIIRLNHTDAAGIIFYGRLFDLIHHAYEAFLDDIGAPLPVEMGTSSVVIPIVHTSADYRIPLKLNDRVRIEVAVAKVSRRSFTLGYSVLRRDEVAVEARTVHVAVDRSSGHATSLPKELVVELRSRLEVSD